MTEKNMKRNPFLTNNSVNDKVKDSLKENVNLNISSNIKSDIQLNSTVIIPNKTYGSPKKVGHVKRPTSNRDQGKKSNIALFIGGLTENVTEDMLVQTFKEYQSFVSAKICIDLQTKKSLGYGYLNFSKQNDVDLMVERFNYRPLFDCQEIKIMPSLRNTFYRKNIGTNVFFSNLPLDNRKLTTRFFYDTFKFYGKILSCKLDYRKNIGFVYFDNNDSAKKLIYDYNEKDFLGKKIICGIHFDKEIRDLPDFSKRKQKLDSKIIIKEELNIGDEKSNSVESKFHEVFNIKLPYPNSIYIKNLPLNTPEEELLDYFSEIGPIKSIFSSNVHRYKSLWAIISYKNIEDANKAMSVHNETIYKGKVILVTKAQLKNNTSNKNIKNPKTATFVKLTNLSLLCGAPYLFHIFKQSSIAIDCLRLVPKINTYEAYIKCQNKTDAILIFQLLNHKIIGNNKVLVTWSREDDFYESSKRNVEFKPDNTSNTKQIISMSQDNPFIPHEKIQNSNYNNNNIGVIEERDKISVNDTNNNNEYELMKKNVFKILNKNVKKITNILNLSDIIKVEDIEYISTYVFEVFWDNNIEELSIFLNNIDQNTRSQSILHKHVKEAAKYLGY